MEQPFIDYNAISADISQKCNKILKFVDVNTVSDSFDAVKEIVGIAIEKYSYRVSEYWLAINSDAEISRKIKFTDVDHGYEILIKKWVEENPFKAEYPECPEDFTESYEDYAAKLNKKAVATAVAGTAAIGAVYSAGATCSKGWLIFGNPIVAIAAELIGIAALYAVVQNKKKTKQQEIEVQKKELEEKLKSYKKDLIEVLTISSESYVKNAVVYSNNILASF